MFDYLWLFVLIICDYLPFWLFVIICNFSFLFIRDYLLIILLLLLIILIIRHDYLWFFVMICLLLHSYHWLFVILRDDYMWLFAIICYYSHMIICNYLRPNNYNNQQIITNKMCTASNYLQSLGRRCSLIVRLKARIHCSSSESPTTFLPLFLEAGALSNRWLAHLQVAPSIIGNNGK